MLIIRRVPSTYSLLRLRLHEHVAVSQVIDLDILNVVAVRHIHLARSTRHTLALLRRSGAEFGSAIVRGTLNGGYIDVLDAFARLKLRIDLGGRGSCIKPVRIMSILDKFRLNASRRTSSGSWVGGAVAVSERTALSGLGCAGRRGSRASVKSRSSLGFRLLLVKARALAWFGVGHGCDVVEKRVRPQCGRVDRCRDVRMRQKRRGKLSR